MVIIAFFATTKEYLTDWVWAIAAYIKGTYRPRGMDLRLPTSISGRRAHLLRKCYGIPDHKVGELLSSIPGRGKRQKRRVVRGKLRELIPSE